MILINFLPDFLTLIFSAMKKHIIIYLLLLGLVLQSTAQTIISDGVLRYTETRTRTANTGKVTSRIFRYTYTFSFPWLKQETEMETGVLFTTLSNSQSATAMYYATDGSKFYEMDDNFSGEFPELGLYNTVPATIEYTDETKTIKGYECKRAIITCNIDGRIDKVTTWYMPGIQVETKGFNFFFKDLKGLPVSFSLAERPKMVIGERTSEYVCEYLLDTFYTITGNAAAGSIANKEKYEWIDERDKMAKLFEMLRPNTKRTAPKENKGTPVQEKITSANGSEIVVTRYNPFKEGEKLQDFEGLNTEGQKRTLGNYSGKVVVINFWFIQCAPCVKEMPLLNNVVDNNKTKEVAFISITYDTQKEVVGFLQKHAFDFETIADAGKLVAMYGVSVFPATVVLDKQGIIRFIKIGGFKRAKELQQEIDKLL